MVINGLHWLIMVGLDDDDDDDIYISIHTYLYTYDICIQKCIYIYIYMSYEHVYPSYCESDWSLIIWNTHANIG
jgi:hypothetical protein